MEDQTASILVVEDEPSVADVITQQLENAGYKVIGSVPSGNEAIASIEKQRPDLVLMDVILVGNRDGIDTAQEVQVRFDVPVVFLTAYADDQTFSRITNLKPYGYLVKPVKQVELSFAVGLALEQHKFKRKVAALSKDAERIEAPLTQKILSGGISSGSESSDVVAALKKINVFAHLSEQHIALLAQRGVRRFFEAGENILFEGEDEKRGFVVISGVVSIIKSSSAKARELIVDTVTPGDPSGLVAMIERVPSWFTARAQSDADVLLIGSSLLITILDQQPECYRDILLSVSEKLRSSYNLSRCLAYDSVEERIAEALSFLAERAGVKDSKTGLPSLRLTRRELADFTGTTVETAYRVTKKMERDGYLQLTNPGLIANINVKKLKNYEALSRPSN